MRPVELSPPVSAGPLSHDRAWCAGVVQSVARPGVIDLGPGYLEPALLPVDLVREAYAVALAEFGSAALGYGDDRGALVLRAALAARAARAARVPCDAGHVLVTAGISQALQLISTTLAGPGNVVMGERLGYDYGRRIMADCRLDLCEVASDAAGMVPGALDEAIRAARAAERTVAFAYLNPTFHNPTGRVVPLERRLELLDVVTRHDLLVVEDDAYGDAALDGVEPPRPLAALAGYRRIVQLCSLSKTVGAGLRLGWLIADPEIVDRLAGHGQLVSGGSLNHTTSLAAAVMVRDGAFDRHLAWLRPQLRLRRDALVGALREHLPASIDVVRPGGGFFVWLEAGGGHTEEELLRAADHAGLAVAAGSRFGTPARPSLRLAFTLNPPERLARAGRRLADSLTEPEPSPEWDGR